MTTKLIAYLGDPQLKAKYMRRVRYHRQADQIVQGLYWTYDESGRNGKGCAVGCTIHSSSHQDYETLLGVPAVLARMEDVMFEEMPFSMAINWPLRFLSAIQPGADLSKVADLFLRWILVNPFNGLCHLAESPDLHNAIMRTGDLFTRRLKGETITQRDYNEVWGKIPKNYDDSVWVAAINASYYAWVSHGHSVSNAIDSSISCHSDQYHAIEAYAAKFVQLLKEAPLHPEFVVPRKIRTPRKREAPVIEAPAVEVLLEEEAVLV
jgi:hypothetical protein